MIARTLKNKQTATKIIVIDEIDAFEAHEKGFLALTKAILESKTNTILIGIANSVDLPFKKKHSAIALRDQQLLFEPYTEEQIVSIIEQKINLQHQNMSERMKKNPTIRNLFFDIIDDSAKELIAKRVSRMNGDLRVAFDIIKSCFLSLQQRSHQEKGLVKGVSMVQVARVFEIKYASKIPETLRKLPRQNLNVLEVLADTYEGFGSEGLDRKMTYFELYGLLEKTGRRKHWQKIHYSEMDQVMEVLSNYNLIEIDRKNVNRKDAKAQKFCLKVELQELQSA